MRRCVECNCVLLSAMSLARGTCGDCAEEAIEEAEERIKWLEQFIVLPIPKTQDCIDDAQSEIRRIEEWLARALDEKGTD